MPWFVRIILILASLLAAFITYILVNAILAKNQRSTKNEARKNVDESTLNGYVEKLQKMLRCKTVYTQDDKYKGEFIKFQEVLKQEFPTLHKNAELKSFDGC